MGGTLFLVATAALLGGALGAILWPSGSGARRVAMLAACLGSLAALASATVVLVAGAPWTLQAPGLLAPFGGLSLSLDRLGAFFLALIGFTGAPAALYGLGYTRHLDPSPRGRLMHAMVNLFLLGMCLVPAASNTVTLLFGWELMAIASYVLVVADPTQPDAPAAGLWYAVMTHAGFLALLAAFLILGQDGSGEFAALRQRALALSPGARTWAFGLALLAFGSKAGLLPVHVWLPRAHPAAPSHVSALMSAAMVKLGLYGFIRVVFDLLPPGPPWWGGLLLTLGVATALAGVLYAVAESHLKRVLAYSTIENIGVIFVAVGFAVLMRGYGYQALAAMGLAVGLLHALNHAAFKSLLFLSAGAVVHGAHSAALEDFGGLIRRMPHTALFCLIGVLGLAALPPLNGFPSEWLTFQLLVAGTRDTAPELAVVLPLALAGVALSAGLAAVAGVRLFGMTFLALPRSRAAAQATEATPSMRWAMVVPAAACLVLGFMPTSVFPMLNALVADLGLPARQMSLGASLALPLVGSRLWPAGVLLALAAGAVVVMAVLRARKRAGTARVAGVWNCGNPGQSARSEYTAASFAEPLRRVFTGFYQPTQEVTVLSHPVSRYFVQSVAYRTRVAPWMEQALYAPVLRLARWLSRQAARIQVDSIHVYLAYLPGALLLLLLLSHWIGR